MAAPWSWRDYLDVEGSSGAEERLDDEVAEPSGSRGPRARSFVVSQERGGDGGGRRQRWATAARGAPFAAALLLCAAVGRWLHAAPRRTRSVTEDAVDDYLLKGWEPAYITWSAHPNKCWDVLRPKGLKNGMKLQMWDCADTPDKFMIPQGGFGPIRLASAPEYCLDAPGRSTMLQFWKCTESPRENVLFSVPTGRTGRIHPANHTDKCVDVPNGDTSNGRRVIQWSCNGTSQSADMMFVIHWPVTCKWGSWSAWSDCSSACRTTRTRKQYVEHRDARASPGNCDAVVKQVNSCSPKECTLPDDDLALAPGNDTAQEAKGRPTTSSHSGARSRGWGLALRGAAHTRSLTSSSGLLVGLLCLWMTHW